MFDQLEIESAINTLKAQMKDAGLLTKTKTFINLEQIVAQLNPNEFLHLRTLPAFQKLLALLEQTEKETTIKQNLSTYSRTTTHAERDIDAKKQNAALHNEPLVSQPSSTVTKTTKLMHPHTILSEARLGGRYDKLIARLITSITHSKEQVAKIECIEDVLNLTEENFLKLEGVGKTYKEDWYRFKELYSKASDFLPLTSKTVSVSERCYDVQSDMQLNLTQLHPDELKAVTKLGRAMGKADIQTILNINTLEPDQMNSLGKRSRSALQNIRSRLIIELELIEDEALNYHLGHSSLIIASVQSFESVTTLGRYILERLDLYLAGLDEKSQLIFQHRWGFIDEQLTLSEIGEKFSVTRERIRQLESKINERLNTYLALDEKNLWDNAKSLPTHELTLQMSELSSCFLDQKNFHEFLTFVSHGRVTSVATSISPPLNLLDNYFALHGTSIPLKDALQQIQHSVGGDEKDAYNALHYLQSRGKITLTQSEVRPLRLGKHEAAAAILSEHTNGLPWLDIVRHVNRRGISRNQLSEKVAGHGLQDSQLMYVAGTGIYRHTRFIDFSTINENFIFETLNNYLSQYSGKVSHLSQAYESSPALRENDYYIVRYIVKMRGEVHGIYFNGKSQTDSISQNQSFDLYSQKSVILQAMSHRKNPMTKSEIAQLLKSRSSDHASLYIHEMTQANQIVQVDRMLYTTPEIAYKNLDLNKMRSYIASTLKTYDKPVDPSIIQLELNCILEESYSKFFYSSLARYFAQQHYWHRRQNLFAFSPISFSSLTDVIDRFCSAGAGIGTNIEALLHHVAITEDAAKISIYNWRAFKQRQTIEPNSPRLEELEDE